MTNLLVSVGNNSSALAAFGTVNASIKQLAINILIEELISFNISPLVCSDNYRLKLCDTNWPIEAIGECFFIATTIIAMPLHKRRANNQTWSINLDYLRLQVHGMHDSMQIQKQ